MFSQQQIIFDSFDNNYASYILLYINYVLYIDPILWLGTAVFLLLLYIFFVHIAVQ